MGRNNHRRIDMTTSKTNADGYNRNRRGVLAVPSRMAHDEGFRGRNGCCRLVEVTSNLSGVSPRCKNQHLISLVKSHTVLLEPDPISLRE
jgi:hypothetical protein